MDSCALFFGALICVALCILVPAFHCKARHRVLIRYILVAAGAFHYNPAAAKRSQYIIEWRFLKSELIADTMRGFGNPVAVFSLFLPISASESAWFMLCYFLFRKTQL
jgi:hypothetical protein